VALKILVAKHSLGQAITTPELEILLKIRDADSDHPGRRHVVTMHDYFQHHGPNGAHDCFVFEVLGQTVEALRLQQDRQHDARRLPIPIVKQISRQLLLGLEYLHSICGVVHTGKRHG